MSLINLFVSARDALASRRQRQRAYGDLAMLDDRSLADIGLHRSQLPAMVDGYHNAVELDSTPAAMLPSAWYTDPGLSLTQQWLRRI
jgi:uncharacterized protein YjiS (DUF1127 family)